MSILFFIKASILFSLKLLTRKASIGMPTIMITICPFTFKNFINRALREIQKYEKMILPTKTLTKLL